MVMGLIYKKDGYYFRGYIPKELLAIMKTKTIDKKLHTLNNKLARSKEKRLSVVFTYIIEEIFMAYENGEIYVFLDRKLKELFDTKETALFNLPHIDLEQKRDNGHFDDELETIKDIVSYKKYNFITQLVRDMLRGYLIEYTRNTDGIAIYSDEINEYIANNLLVQARSIRENINNNYYHYKPQAKAESNQSTTLTPDIKMTIKSEANLSKYIDEYINEINALKSPNDSTISLYRTSLKTLLLGLGNIDIRTITRKNLIEIREKTEVLPSKWGDKKSKNFSMCETLDEIIQKNKELKIKTISVNTRNKYLSNIKSFFNWADKNNYIPKNIAPEESIKPTKKQTKESERRPFTTSELETIFSSTFYTVELTKNIQNNIEQVLIPIIALYSGLRLNEISSLYIEDIKEKNGIYYMDINYNLDKTVKNDDSERLVPIHSMLIQMGFLRFIKTLNNKDNTRIWKKLKKKLLKKDDDSDEAYGNYGGAISGWFNKFIRGHNIKDKRVVFHSTRHTAINNLKQKKLQETLVAQLVGHSNDGITFDRYADDYPLLEMNSISEEIHYDVKSLAIAIDAISQNIK